MSAKLKVGVITDVAVSSLSPDKNQPRKKFDTDALKALGETMRVKIVHPLTVRYEGKELIIVDGERRWRAAKLAKIAKLPCELIALDKDDNIQLRAVQFITSEQRESLQPLEVAEFLVRLQKTENKTPNELLAALAKRGIHDMGKVKMEKLMQLTKLPDWFKGYIEDGKLTASHGAIALAALPFEAVMLNIRDVINNQIDWKGTVTVKEFQEEIVEEAFAEIGFDLNKKHGKESDIRIFPINVCHKCEFYKKLGKQEYCMNSEEFYRKNNEALALKQVKESGKKANKEDENKSLGRFDPDPAKVTPRKLTPTKEGVIKLQRMDRDGYRNLEDAVFDVAGCEGCPHKRVAHYNGDKEDAHDHCFHPPCFEVKRKTSGRMAGRTENMRLYLDEWLRPVVKAIAPTALTLVQKQGVMLWLAVGAVDHFSPYVTGQMHQSAADKMRPFIKAHKLIDLPAIMNFATADFTEIHANELIQHAVNVFTKDQIRWFAHYINIDLGNISNLAPYRIDAAYLNLKRKGELLELAKLAGVESVAGLGVGEIKTLLLDPKHVNAIGVPADIERLYREEIKAPEFDPMDFDDEDTDNDDSAFDVDAIKDELSPEGSTAE